MTTHLHRAVCITLAFSLSASSSETSGALDAELSPNVPADLVALHLAADFPLTFMRDPGVFGASVFVTPVEWLLIDARSVGLPAIQAWSAHLRVGPRVRRMWTDSFALWIAPAVGVHYLIGPGQHGVGEDVGLNVAFLAGAQWWLSPHLGISLAVSGGWNFWSKDPPQVEGVYFLDATVSLGLVMARW
jgi:hypothetical protein